MKVLSQKQYKSIAENEASMDRHDCRNCRHAYGPGPHCHTSGIGTTEAGAEVMRKIERGGWECWEPQQGYYALTLEGWKPVPMYFDEDAGPCGCWVPVPGKFAVEKEEVKE